MHTVVGTGIGQVTWLYDIAFRPSDLFEGSSAYTSQSILDRLSIVVSVTLFFLANVLLYALPLSLAGIGFVEDEPAHPQFAEFSQGLVNDPDYWWMVLVRLVNNAEFLVIFGFLTYVLFHVGIWLTGKSKGLIQSYRIVMINTSIYLAIIFNLAWYAVGSERTAIARDFVDWLFREYFAFVANLVGTAPPFPVELPPNLANLSPMGKATLVALLVSVCYYVYVLYIGARKVHDLTRYEAAVVMGFALSSPLLFAAGSILIDRFVDLPPVVTL